MKEYQIPSFTNVAFAGSAWLAGIAFLLVVPFSGVTSVADLIVRELVGGALLLSAAYLFRLGLTSSNFEDSSRAMVREAIRRIDRTRRAA